MDTCVMCGKYAGEGRQVCLQCEYEIIQKCDRCMYEDTDMCLKCKYWRCAKYEGKEKKKLDPRRTRASK